MNFFFQLTHCIGQRSLVLYYMHDFHFHYSHFLILLSCKFKIKSRIHVKTYDMPIKDEMQYYFY